MGAFEGGALDTDLSRFIIQLCIIVCLCRVLGYLLRYFKQPMVVAEIIGGILLGPSAFGYIKPFEEHVFPSSSIPMLSLFANVGLIMFMFLIGLELDDEVVAKNLKNSAFISLVGIAAPFGLGSLVAYYIHDADNSDEDLAIFVVFLGVAMSITAFPVLARILAETKLITTNVGILALSSAAVDDVVAWVCLALIVSFVRATSQLTALWTVMCAVGYAACMFYPIRKLFEWVVKNHKDLVLSPTGVAATFLLLFLSAWMTEFIGIHAIFGGFIFGVIVPRQDGLPHKLAEKIEDVVVLLLLPLYFTNSGLKTQINKLDSGVAWIMILLTILAACVGKIGGCTLSARYTGLNWRESFALGILKNSKGLVELIVLNIGLDYGVISETVFTVMVMMALVTTFITTPFVLWVYPYDLIMQDERAKFAGKFTVLLCPDTRNNVLKMISLARSLTSDGGNNKVYALRVLELSDRPSVYMTSHIHETDEVLAAFHHFPKLKVEVLREISTNPKDDICNAAANKGADVVILAADREELFANTINRYILKTATTNVGVLVTESAAPSANFKRILVPYWSPHYDTIALKIVRKMTKLKGTVVDVMLMAEKDVYEADTTLRSALRKRAVRLADGTTLPEPVSASNSTERKSTLTTPSTSQGNIPHALAVDSTNANGHGNGNGNDKQKEPTHEGGPSASSSSSSIDYQIEMTTDHIDEILTKITPLGGAEPTRDSIMDFTHRYDLMVVSLQLDHLPLMRELIDRCPIPMLVIRPYIHLPGQVETIFDEDNELNLLSSSQIPVGQTERKLSLPLKLRTSSATGLKKEVTSDSTKPNEKPQTPLMLERHADASDPDSSESTGGGHTALNQ